MKHVKGPDLPTGAEIISPRADLKEFYEKGVGTFKARATCEIEDGNIVITAFPYQVSPTKVQEQIAEQMRAKKLPMVDDDSRRVGSRESDAPRHRAALQPRRHRLQLMNHLFATTDLERSYRVNLNIIGARRPAAGDGPARRPERVAGVPHRTVTRRLEHRLDKVARRLHILEGLLIAFLNLDEVIRIIRREDEPKPVLMKRFKLSEEQTEEILNTRLRHLAKLEEMKIRDEQKALARRARGDRGLLEEQGEAEEARSRERDPRRCREVRRRAAHQDHRARGRAGDR